MNLNHDALLTIATGKSRKEIRWQNKEMLWSEISALLSKTHRTTETHAEYMKSTKSRQDEIKDIGGFVAGTLANGRRKKDTVTGRSMLTLDVDFASTDFWDNYTMLFNNAALIYSTHKHTPKNPRLRLVIPLSREVFADEYIAVARRIAGTLGIEQFDDSTFEPSRLMYYPSTCKDGEFVFKQLDGEFLDPDEILKSYKDWKDVSEYPTSNRVVDHVNRSIKIQGDPLEKTGVIGAFCRTYTIHEAIENFLPDEYAPSDEKEGAGRYSYKRGSTANGLVTYDDKFAFSHHGTDPCSGKLCNAFDLVRIHLFGLKDDDVKENTPINKYPSFLAMENFASEDKEVRKTLHLERIAKAKGDFEEGLEESTEDIDVEWATNLETDKKGICLNTIENCSIIFNNDPEMVMGKLSYNEFRNTNDVLGTLPWDKSKLELGIWGNFDNAELLAWFEKKYKITSEKAIKTARMIVLNNRRHHPVKDYLKKLKWDGEKRVETLFIDYLGAEDIAYTRTVTRKSIVAAVARIFNPGCKYDQVPVLVGPEGIGKSFILQQLGKEWFSDNFHFNDKGDNKNIEQLIGAWITEIQELAGFYGKNAEAIKSFISTRRDETRLAFKEEKGYFPRQGVFFATTNVWDFLNSTNGNRRFWPIVTRVQEPTKDFKEIHKEVDQIWAEAVQIHKQGEPLYLEDREMELFAKTLQERHREVDEWETIIANFVESDFPENWEEIPQRQRTDAFEFELTSSNIKVKRDKFSVEDIWIECFKKGKDIDNISAKRIRKAMRLLKNWEDAVIRVNGKVSKGYKRKQV